jgi:hypothetical protein
VWCGVVWCGVVWCGVVWCGVVWCGVVWCGVVWSGVVWCGVEWCGVVWCGVVWCGVVWCGTTGGNPLMHRCILPKSVHFEAKCTVAFSIAMVHFNSIAIPQIHRCILQHTYTKNTPVHMQYRN